MKRRYNNGEYLIKRYIFFSFFKLQCDGYSLEPWLMTSLKHEKSNMPRFQYNENLCSARSCIKRFDVWKAMFRCLTTQRRLIYEPGMAGKIINACAVLHNMRIAHGIHDDLEIDEMDNEHLDHRINPVVEHEDFEEHLPQVYRNDLLFATMEEINLSFLFFFPSHEIKDSDWLNFLCPMHFTLKKKSVCSSLYCINQVSLCKK
ncbi:hypothetical protein ALC53_09242 [Atta colombica]|uniref:DDE Tnp4 domain-containing protein n=1 Tax=Atta colombica TaxID=520822 RepID=A0A195B6K4_9HYME|nr:hypothetical protein ALC53_09242 [Atta colombica]